MIQTNYFKGGQFLCVLVVLCLVQSAYTAVPSQDYGYAIDCDYWYMKFDTAGYADGAYWGNSPYHPHNEHELLSGEWAASIYYDGIATDSNAMWLTDYFLFPDWSTISNFQIDTWSDWEDDSNNPVNGYDKGHSIIKNDEVEVTIDYEVVDVNEVGWFSPLTYHLPNDSNTYLAKSERYIFLQTYTIKHIKSSRQLVSVLPRDVKQDER